MSRRSILILALTLLVSFVAGCRTAPIKDVTNSRVPASGVSEEQVRKAIMAAGAGLGWMMKERSPGLIDATLALRSHVARVEIRYSTRSYSIKYKSSTNLKYKAESRTIHSNYNDWVQNLDNAIRAQLSML